MKIVETECQTPGANYTTSISDDEIAVTVELPPEVRVPDMSEKQGQGFDDLIHDAMEEVVAKIIGELDAEAEEHWAAARANDSVTESPDR